MTADELNHIYGAIISPSAAIDIPEHWFPAIHEALAAFRDLPSSIRAFMIVTGIRDSDGLVIEIGAVPDLMPADGLQRIGEIVGTAQAAVKGSRH
ncbi:MULTISPECIES: hypothetical protein [Rhizobium/Agrobacterium group]|uniref:Uncharacterized protein n=1 Tax=Agrobacterium genomosp. 2 str. CFBP 5494 TaxID=1183436 RepID=A0A9W5EZG5_9HYPH|nr:MULTISPECIES: hypothetical protein [Rhizobium/Agrobacterium group]CAD7036490.1 hypothetical protein RP007_04462 [Rhizobium sp. P007]CUW88486.1 hypothetical protein AGR2A_Cc140076 [Agrobacterium genomosp. 2 str. CFBP 5494]